MVNQEISFPCERCGQTVRTGVTIEPGATDTSIVGTIVQCSHCGHSNSIELDHVWRARQAALGTSERRRK